MAIEIDKATGAVAILDAVTVLECGRALVPQQGRRPAEGGFRDGRRLRCMVSAAYERPRRRHLNLADRYRVPRASDLPVWKR